MNAVSQDAFLGRGTHSPYLDILNHIELSALEDALQAKYGKASKAAGADKKERDRKRNELSRQTETTQRRGRDYPLPERMLIADIIGDLVEDLPEDEIVRRKVGAIKA
ncbi:hypothetical protein DL769_010978 [Monosporascus sp. CRB-8-3]|nr:hypothetical protein DL769_010978 [Monosporascus sp. CRB-8-3]